MNRLNQESSPYLLQHKDNPIHWWAWGKDAFQAAKDLQRPIFLSVGYSTCHWCHVMAHESFESSQVAEVLNSDFIAIKVDREERPDVDEVYMKALLAMSGGGGWPMSVWLTPEGKPFFAGTYFPKDRFIQLLKRIAELWEQDKGALISDSERLLQALQREDLDQEKSEDSELDLARHLSHFQYAYDEIYGGFGQAPKFPQTMNLRLLMRLDLQTGLNQAQELVTHTLKQMAQGGMYDHLHGGFHRYSVDREWLVPHFEKMLYDQAMIVSTLLEARALYGVREFDEVIRETLDYVLTELQNAKGGFFAAQDADSLDPKRGEMEEGFFATYSFEELKNTFDEQELDFLSRVYGVSADGQFEGRNILHLQKGYDRTIKQDPIWSAVTLKLKKIRAGKPLPHLDDKVIASWNGWMISALSQAFIQMRDERYLKAAQDSMRFVLEKMNHDHGLHRYWRQEKAKASATSEDYASLIAACLDLYQADFDPQWAQSAIQLQSTLDQRFWDEGNGGYFISDGSDENLPMRSKDDHDGVYPCANSMAAHNLLKLYALTGDIGYREKLNQLKKLYGDVAQKHPGRMSHLAAALADAQVGVKVAVLGSGDWVREFHKQQAKNYQPQLIWAASGPAWPVTENKSEQAIYICQEGRCLQPALNAEMAISQLATKK